MPTQVDLSRDFASSWDKLSKHSKKISDKVEQAIKDLIDSAGKPKVEYLKGGNKYRPFRIKLGDHWRVLGCVKGNVIVLLDVVTREEANRRYKEMTSKKFKPPTT